MPNYRRADIPGGTYFFTVNTFRRQAILIHDRVPSALRQAIESVKHAYPFSIEAWVLLPDHMHCIWKLPLGNADFSLRWAMIKRYVTKECSSMTEVNALSESRQKRKEGAFWQRRFWEHAIRDEEDLRRHMDYIHWNPVKHGYVKQVKDWRYSSFHRFVTEGVYPENWGGIEETTIDESQYGE